MKNRSKKNLLNIIVLAAISFFVVSNFAPSFSMSSKDLLEDFGYEKIDNYVDINYYYFFSIYKTFDNTKSHSNEENIVRYNFMIMHCYSVILYEEETTGGMSDPFQGLVSASEKPSAIRSVIDVIVSFFSVFLVFFYIYFCYKNFRYIGKEKNRYPLYASFLGFVIIIGFYIAVIRLLAFFNPYFPNYIKLAYGFYCMIISSILFLVTYILQNYVDFNKEELNE